MVLDQGYSHIEAARSVGLVESALLRWVKQLQEKRLGVTPKSKALTPEQQKSRSWKPGSTGWSGRKRSLKTTSPALRAPLVRNMPITLTPLDSGRLLFGG